MRPVEYENARRLHRSGMLHEAEQACRNVLRHDGRHLGALRVLIDILRQTGRTPDAARLLEDVATSDAADAAVLSELGLLALACNSHRAVAILQRALELDPTLVPEHNNLGIALKRLGRFDEAEVCYRNAIRLEPSYAAAHHNLGELLQHRGQLTQARRSFETALQHNPRLTHSRLTLGDVLTQLGEPRSAVEQYQKAVETSPASLRAHAGLAVALRRLGEIHAAVEAFARVVAGMPSSAEAHCNLGSAQLEAGRVAEALDSLRAALRLQPDFPEAQALYAAALVAAGDIDAGIAFVSRALAADAPVERGTHVLAHVLLTHGLFAQARLCLERRLLEQPADVMAQHVLAALKGENPEQPSEEFVRKLFDASAATFDTLLVSELRYVIPREMVDALLTVEGAPQEPWDVLDLGCGTGLVGVEIASRSRRLVGVDLSAKMIEQARERGLYTELHCMELLTALTGNDVARYDVITAADVFVYVGKLDALIPAVGGVLRPGGLFTFTVEAAEDTAAVAATPTSDGYRLGPKGRYAHSLEYLQSLADAGGFRIALLRKTRIRFEQYRPVLGWLTVWRSVASAQR